MTDVKAILQNSALTPEEVSRVLRTSRSGIYNCLKDGTVPSFSVGGQYRIPAAWVRKQLRIDEPEAA